MRFACNNAGPGVRAEGASGAGILCMGDTNSAGFECDGSGAAGFLAVGDSAPGVHVIGGGGGTNPAGMFFDGGPSGPGIEIAATDGHGVKIQAGGSGKHGIISTGGTNGDGFHGVGQGTGVGFYSTPDAVGFGSGGGGLTVGDIAQQVLIQSVATVEGTMPEHCLGTVILACLEWERSMTEWIIKRTDGVTTHKTKAIVVADGQPVVSVA